MKEGYGIPIIAWLVLLPIFMSIGVDGVGFNRIGGVDNSAWLVSVPISIIFSLFFIFRNLKLKNIPKKFIYLFIYFILCIFLIFSNKGGVDYSAIKVIIMMTSFLFFLYGFRSYFNDRLDNIFQIKNLENRYILYPLTIISLISIVSSLMIEVPVAGGDYFVRSAFLTEQIMIYNFEQYFTFIFILAIGSATRLNTTYFFILCALFTYLIMISANKTALILMVLMVAYYLMSAVTSFRWRIFLYKTVKISILLIPIIYLLTLYLLDTGSDLIDGGLIERHSMFQNYLTKTEWYQLILPLSNEFRGVTNDMHNEFLEVFNATSLVGLLAFYYLIYKEIYCFHNIYKMQSISILLIIFIGGITVENTLHLYLLVILAYVISFYGAMSSYILNERDDRMEQY